MIAPMRTVPLSSIATSHSRNGVALVAPMVLVELMVKLVAAWTERITGSPFAVVASRNGINTGLPELGSLPSMPLSAIVRLLDPTEALIRRLTAPNDSAEFCRFDAATETAGVITAWPLAFWYRITCQLPDPSET